MSQPKPPQKYKAFIKRYPKLMLAWEHIAEAGREGQLDAKTQRLIKLSVAIGALKEGAVHASIRKALSLKISREEIEQVVALSAGTIGLPSAVAVFTWMQDSFKENNKFKKR